MAGSIWSDHTNIQPTMMELLGLRDDYTPDGRVLAEVIKPSALRASLKTFYPTLVRLGDAFTAINAAVGPFGLDTMAGSAIARSSTAAGDITYTKLESLLAGLGSQRDMLVRADEDPAVRRGVPRQAGGREQGGQPDHGGGRPAVVRQGPRLSRRTWQPGRVRCRKPRLPPVTGDPLLEDR